MPFYEATDADAGTRVDVVLARVTGFSRSHVGAALRSGAATIDGEPAKPSMSLEPGQRVEFAIEPPQTLRIDADASLPLTVLYEDEHVLVVDKPAGMVTHPAHGAPEGTLVNALLARYATLPGERSRAGLVHRLDKDTSGLLVVAKTGAALTTLGHAMEKRYIDRRYRGIIVGTPRDPEGTIDGAIGRDQHHRLKRAIRNDGKPAITHYSTREAFRTTTELEFKLETGRTHQIRVHLAAMGHPLLNDPLYGRGGDIRALGMPGQALHAYLLAFKHPVSRVPLHFEIAPPAPYLDTLDRLRLTES